MIQSATDFYDEDLSPIENMVKFAQAHTTEALKAASEKAYAKADRGSMSTKSGNLYWTFGGNIGDVIVPKEPILNAYSLENIK